MGSTLAILRSGKVRVGAAILAFFVLLAVLGPWLIRTVLTIDPTKVDYDAIAKGPSADHWLGTTTVGTDVLAQLVLGARGSVFVGLLSGVIATVVAAVLGVWSGYVGGTTDRVLNSVTNIVMTLPGFALLIIVAGYVQNASWVLVASLIGALEWPSGARFLRAQATSMRQRDFTAALKSVGERQSRIVLVEVMPHMSGLISAMFLRAVVAGVFAEAGLAFLGIASSGTISWGTMIAEAQQQNAILRNLWWWIAPPGLCIAFIGMGTALFNFGLDELSNPTLRTANRHIVQRFLKAQRRDRLAARNKATPTLAASQAAYPAVGSSSQGDMILEARGLDVDYLTTNGTVRACSAVDLTVHRGEIVGVAGESASGKSTLLTALTRLQRPPAVTSGGSVVYRTDDGREIDLTELDEKQLAPLRWADISIVMQSAMACLNPVKRLGAQFEDVLRHHDSTMSRKQAAARTRELLQMVGIAGDRAQSYPHEMSGGMRQRALIALSLACDPEIVVMDEPTTAVDVVMQRQIMSQILQLQKRLGFAVIFVTHDLSLLLEIADRIAIMYAGRIVEVASAEQIYTAPQHPYTRGLRESFPPLSEPVRELTGIPGTPPDLRLLPVGCSFAARCPKAFEACTNARPELLPSGSGEVACFLHQPHAQTAEPSLVGKDLS